MSRTLTAKGASLPDVSYGPFRVLEAVPWLMFAAAMRVLTIYGGMIWLVAMMSASFAVLLAFVVAARRAIEWAGGHTTLGRLDFDHQLRLAGRVLLNVVLLLIVAIAVALALKEREIAPQLIFGLDGIAFDQATDIGRIWSSFLAATVFLMVVGAGTGGKASLFAATRAFAEHAGWMLVAVLLIVGLQLGLSIVQGMVRGEALAYWRSSPDSEAVRSLVYFLFIFGFAAVRLWATIAILTLALRTSYRQATT